MYLRFLVGAIVAIPLLPIIYFQGKKVRSSVPKLPEAKGKEGVTGQGKRVNLLAIGESTIAGVGVDTHEEGFTGAMARELALQLGAEISWKVYARSGYTAAKLRDKLIPKIQDTKVDLIVVGLGGNDAFTLNTPWSWSRDVKEGIQALRLKYPEAPIVFANMPPIKLFPAFTAAIHFVLGNLVEIHGQALARLVSRLAHVYYNTELITFDRWINRWKIDPSNADFFSDGVHPSKLTYQTWGKDLANFIVKKEILNIPIQRES